MNQPTIQQIFDQAIKNHQSGRLREAEQIYREIVKREPGHGEAWCNLGNVLRDEGQFDESIAAYRRALALNENSAGIWSNLGNTLKDKGELDEAIGAYRQAIRLAPNFPGAYSNLGNALKANGQLDEAIDALRKAIALDPNYAEAHSNLGIALKDKGHLDEAIAAHRRAIAIIPNYAAAHSNLGIALNLKGQLDEAIAAHRWAIALRPNYADAHNNLGIALNESGQVDEAIAAYRQAIAIRPNYAEAYNNLGNVLTARGQIDEAIAAYRKALTLKRDYAEAHGNLAFVLHYHPGYDAAAIAEEHRLWNQLHAEPLAKFVQPHGNNRDPDRRLRIGYVSGDFKEHPVGRFVLPLLEKHDHGQFEVFCYSNTTRVDGITARIRSNADQWREIVGVSDEQVAGQIRADEIDILVDLAGHTAGNRLLVFARKPAPVQVSYLGYPGSTGLSAIDYRLTDGFADPLDQSGSEKLYRLSRTNWCFSVMKESPAVQPPPVLQRGYVTFGSFNNFAKVNDAVLEVWAEILRQMPGSRLLLKGSSFKALSVRARLEGFFTARGIGADRLDLQNWQADRASHLALYGEMDIALDTFPYNGTTTTCDALWMGVPVVTLAGKTHVSRVGLSLLSNIGFPVTIAKTSDEYVAMTVGLAQDRERLKSLRVSLRERMKSSPLMDAEGFARDVESAYRSMWHG